MSQMVTRKRTGGDEKEKRPESPMKDMKKKMAANAEKEKNAAELASSKPAEKPTDKPADKPVDKPAEKPAEKPQSKVTEKPAEKKTAEKAAEKKDASEKKKEENGKGESSAKPDKIPTNGRPKQNGSNGVNGTVSPESDSDSLGEVDESEVFPELAYDDSDGEWESECPSRSLTRRSQVKATRTPETPRPASDKQEQQDEVKATRSPESPRPASDNQEQQVEVKTTRSPETPRPVSHKQGQQVESKESKVLKLNQESKTDTPKAEAKKSDAKSDAKKDTPKEGVKETQDGVKETKDAKKEVKESPKKNDKKEVKESPKKDDKKEKSDKVEIEIIVDIESNTDPSEESRKTDTNFSKSRVKVSPYRRSMRLADQTTSSIAANYTGNNTTMEMDITESSSFMDETLDDSYLSGLRSIKGRRSYKLLKDMRLRAAVNRSVRSTTSTTLVSEQGSRPTAPVVGRKRKPEPEDNVSVASEATEAPAAGKRQRLLDRLSRPFRRTALMPARRNAEIVGINTDLPLTAPVASTSSFDPEALKAAPAPPAPGNPPPPLAAAAGAPVEDAKRCVVM